MKDVDGLTLANVPEYATNNHWMNVLELNKRVYGEDREALMKRLEENGIQTRPVWALNHLQKPYRDCQTYKVEKAEDLVNNSLCLPSSINLTDESLTRVIEHLNG